MRTIEQIKARCEITDDGHWLFLGGLRVDGRPNIYGPDYTRSDGGMQTQCGLRAVWHIINQRAVPAGWRVFGICEEVACCNPEHIRCAPESEFGRYVRKTKKLKGQTRRILANQAISRKRSRMTPELIQYIQASPKKGVELALELDLSRSLISKARRGEYVAFAGAAGMFGGLIGRSA
ncbi:hypothetical protein [Acidovorax sp. NCPPB 4044]|uniref:hypothetical protein n=1 Tax=Acidovorax sp. NCPPB 4044 TaxID=2940490 RepID=UPI002303411A|nr:hypothetical protein [Acidovorax sp. NCPPB 4044]MDA8522000.1 hypothetical protein [Acidovorax sp. NCPPB 4044]